MRNVTDNFLYLDENDPHREVIMKIIEKYEWPTSLIHCTDEERHAIFKDKKPFSEMICIQDKIREITKDNSYIVIWIPPLVAQSYAIGIRRDHDFFEKNLKIANKMFRDKEVKIVYKNVVSTKERKVIEKKIIQDASLINNVLHEPFPETNIPYIWKYFCLFLKEFQEKNFITYEKKNIILQHKLILQILQWLHFKETNESISFIYNCLEKEYLAAYDNITLFSRSTKPFNISIQRIKNEINRYEK